jgi:putative membrane protein
MLKPLIKKNDSLANILILTVSFVVFAVVVLLSKVKLEITLPFNVHVFAAMNATINTAVAILLVAALAAIKNKQPQLHKNLMFTAIILSVLFLVTYILHHLLSSETKFGGTGMIRNVYFFILITHIALATVILPFILFTAYRALIGEYAKHTKLARYTYPLWLYVSITGPIVYALISPYYV